MFTSTRKPAKKSKRSTLLGRILLWMIAPLFIMWTIGIVITYFISLNLANSPYDKTLANHLRILRYEVEQQHLKNGIHLSESVTTILRGGTDEPPIAWQILDANGHIIAGDTNLPTPESWAYDINQIRYRNATYNHRTVRLAYVWGGRDQDNQGFLTVVAESAESRAVLQQEILTGMLTPQLIILPLAAMLAGLGLMQGLEPLNLLQEHLRKRKPNNLSPIRDDLAPAEIVPLLASMNSLLERLSTSIETQRRFVANAAHQLKTPLAGIRTQSELALRQNDPNQIKASLEQLVTGSQRATRLVNQLLSLAKAESFDALNTKTSEPIDIAAIAQECTSSWVQAAIEKNIDLGFENQTDNTDSLYIFGNSLMITELLNNLIDNAILYTPAKGHVTVRTMATAEQVYLEVQDTGPGVPIAEQNKVFDRFYRILGQKAEGSGLGLAIVQEITELHKGKISFVPLGNHIDPASSGTRLRISLPRYYHAGENT